MTERYRTICYHLFLDPVLKLIIAWFKRAGDDKNETEHFNPVSLVPQTILVLWYISTNWGDMVVVPLESYLDLFIVVSHGLGSPPKEWMLHPHITKQVYATWGQPNFDLFITRYNTWCQVFVSSAADRLA